MRRQRSRENSQKLQQCSHQRDTAISTLHVHRQRQQHQYARVTGHGRRQPQRARPAIHWARRSVAVADSSLQRYGMGAPPAPSHHRLLTPEPLIVGASTCRDTIRCQSLSTIIVRQIYQRVNDVLNEKVIASITRRPYTRRQTSPLIYTRSIANRRHSSTAIKKACLPTLV